MASCTTGSRKHAATRSMTAARGPLAESVEESTADSGSRGTLSEKKSASEERGNFLLFGRCPSLSIVIPLSPSLPGFTIAEPTAAILLKPVCPGPLVSDVRLESQARRGSCSPKAGAAATKRTSHRTGRGNEPEMDRSPSCQPNYRIPVCRLATRHPLSARDCLALAQAHSDRHNDVRENTPAQHWPRRNAAPFALRPPCGSREPSGTHLTNEAGIRPATHPGGRRRAPVFSVVAPSPPGAAPPSVLRSRL